MVCSVFSVPSVVKNIQSTAGGTQIDASNFVQSVDNLHRGQVVSAGFEVSEQLVLDAVNERLP